MAANSRSCRTATNVIPAQIAPIGGIPQNSRFVSKGWPAGKNYYGGFFTKHRFAANQPTCQKSFIGGILAFFPFATNFSLDKNLPIGGKCKESPDSRQGLVSRRK